MECAMLKPWMWAAIAALALSLPWSMVVQWCMTRKGKLRPRGLLLGAFECIIFMVTFAGFAAIGAAWLGFKVASKWKSWSLMAEHVKEKKDDLVKEIDTQYHRFLVGTAGNIVIGLAAAVVGYALGGKAFS